MKRIPITLAQLQIFTVVAESGSFTAASEQLGMTQSAVSHAVSALEKELRVSLLERSRNGAAVTEVGKRVLAQAQTVLACTERIQQDAAAVVGLETGRVRLGSFPSVSAHFLPGLLRQFRQRYPGIEVVLFEGTDIEVKEWIRTSAVDVGTIALPSKEFDTIAISQDEYLAVVPHNHRLANEPQIEVSQLSNEPFIMSKSGCQPLITAMFRTAKVTPKVQFEVIDLRTIFAMVQEGMGVTIVPAMALPLDCSGFQTISLSPKQHRHLAFAVLSLETMTPAVTEFLHEIQTWAQFLPGYKAISKNA